MLCKLRRCLPCAQVGAALLDLELDGTVQLAPEHQEKPAAARVGQGGTPLQPLPQTCAEQTPPHVDAARGQPADAPAAAPCSSGGAVFEPMLGVHVATAAPAGGAGVQASPAVRAFGRCGGQAWWVPC
jgi:hypothetical protein